MTTTPVSSLDKSTHYSKRTVLSFFGGIILCAILLYAIYFFVSASPNSDTAQADFVEVVTETVEQIKQVALTPFVINTPTPENKTSFLYIKVTGGCGVHFNDTECLNVRSGPGREFSVVTQLRNDIVLQVEREVETAEGLWYKIIFDEWLRYPERVASDWYVAAEHVELFSDVGTLEVPADNLHPTTTKKIIIDRSDQTLTAYDKDQVFLETVISTGLDLSPTPRGQFAVFKKTPTRYMQGPIPNIPGSDYYDLPGVPWNLYFTAQGAVIHGAYWHASFGKKYSHGCVNLPSATAETLYHWADIGTVVIVRD